MCVCMRARVCVYSFSSDPRGREETDLTRHIITRRERVMTVGLPWRLMYHNDRMVLSQHEDHLQYDANLI